MQPNRSSKNLRKALKHPSGEQADHSELQHTLHRFSLEVQWEKEGEREREEKVQENENGRQGAYNSF